MRPSIDIQQKVADLVTERPRRAAVFENLGIDYCCGGDIPLADACAQRGVAPQQAVSLLEASDAEDLPAAETPDFGAMGLAELADHILDTHHAYMHKELPRLTAAMRQVLEVHGEKNPSLHELSRVFTELRSELEMHLMKEEQILFPGIKELAASDRSIEFHCGSLGNPISVMEMEHDSAGRALEKMRQLTDNYTPPEWACNTYRALLDGLQRLEKDLHRHIHKENFVLFPRVLERENAMAG